MKLITRAQWGARPSKYDLVYIEGTRGTKVHYEGTAVPLSLLAHHEQCDDRMRALQASHLANPKEDYSDIAYSFVVCPHGYVYEGRGLHRKTGANGDQALNAAHYSVCGMVGSEGYTQPTDAQLSGIRDAIDYLHTSGGAGAEIRGHKDGYATDCPGPALYAWVLKGAPRPAGPVPPAPKPGAPSFPGRQYFLLGATNLYAEQLQTWLQRGNWGPAYKVGPSRTMTATDLAKVKALQQHYLAVLGPADGLTGPKTWQYAYEVAYGLRAK